MDISALRQATAFELSERIVHSCLNGIDDRDQAWLAAWGAARARSSPVVVRRRGWLAGITGHVAESVVEVELDALGYHPLWHFEGPGSGGHGVDLMMLCPSGERVLAIEVKGTLRPGIWPRLTRQELLQMSADWIDKSDNPGMANWSLASTDVYGAVVLVNFADLRYRAALTADFLQLRAVVNLEQLTDLSWLDEEER